MHEVNWKCKKKDFKESVTHYCYAFKIKLMFTFLIIYDLIQLRNHFVPSMLKTPNEWPDAKKFTK